jgi:hypothetical protein
MYIIIMNHDVYNHIMMTQWDHDAPTATTQVIGHVVFRYLAIDQKPKVILAAVPGGMLLESAEFEKWISNITQTKIIKKHKKHKKHEKHNGRVWWHYFSWFLFLSLSLALFHLRPWNPRHVPRSQALHGGLSAGRFYVIQCHSVSLSLCPNMSKQMHINIINTLWWSMMNFAPLEFRNFWTPGRIIHEPIMNLCSSICSMPQPALAMGHDHTEMPHAEVWTNGSPPVRPHSRSGAAEIGYPYGPIPVMYQLCTHSFRMSNFWVDLEQDIHSSRSAKYLVTWDIPGWSHNMCILNAW